MGLFNSNLALILKHPLYIFIIISISMIFKCSLIVKVINELLEENLKKERERSVFN